MSARPNPNFLDEIKALGEKLRSKQTLLVWIPDSADRMYQAKLDEIKASVKLRKLLQSDSSIELYEAE
jgi:hypothetical protein